MTYDFRSGDRKSYSPFHPLVPLLLGEMAVLWTLESTVSVLIDWI